MEDVKGRPSDDGLITRMGSPIPVQAPYTSHDVAEVPESFNGAWSAQRIMRGHLQNERRERGDVRVFLGSPSEQLRKPGQLTHFYE